MCYTPEYNSNDSHYADEILHAREFILHGPHRDYRGAFPWLKGNEKEYPDEQDGDYTDGESDEEPFTPAGLRSHVLKGDDVLWGSDGRCSTTNVCGKGNAEDQSLGEI